jgi:hypothetical protein
LATVVIAGVMSTLSSRGKEVVAMEVKSGRIRNSLPGMEAFSKEFPFQRKLLVGSDGIPVNDHRFLSQSKSPTRHKMISGEDR